MTGAAKGTVLKLLADVGPACSEHQDKTLRNLNCKRVHKSLRVTPAMEAGISDHVWTLEEIAKLAN